MEKISGFSYIRNGFEFDYPFLESIQSILPICDEFIIAVGDSHDGTREAIEKLGSDKIKIIDTIWDENMRANGAIFAQQSNIALDHITGNWAFHIQADEVIHENDLPKIRQAIEKYGDSPKLDGFLLPFLNFFGSYNYYRDSRRAHRFEIRLFRNDKFVRSYKDSQGFRIFSNNELYLNGEKGVKLRVKLIEAPVFHYSYVRPLDLMDKKTRYFNRFWHTDQELLSDNKPFDFANIDSVIRFKGTHPGIMSDRIARFKEVQLFDPSKKNFTFKYWLLYNIEKITNYRLFEYRNYKII
jgi:glycosyltransferase involved in cell wall biosynthesis